ncbi:hypothetical protein ACU686_17375 [Yinghuangia aomiensis]
MLGSHPGMIGVKNGYTTNAQNTFVGAATHDGRTLLVSIMHVAGKGKTHEQTKQLLDWGFGNAAGVKPVGSLVDPVGGSSGSPSASESKKTAQAAAAPAAADGPGRSVDWALWAGVGDPRGPAGRRRDDVRRPQARLGTHRDHVRGRHPARTPRRPGAAAGPPAPGRRISRLGFSACGARRAACESARHSFGSSASAGPACRSASAGSSEFFPCFAVAVHAAQNSSRRVTK